MVKKEVITSTYRDTVKNIHSVLSVLEHYYGAERVDLQNLPSEEQFVDFCEGVQSSLREDSVKEYIYTTLYGCDLAILIYYPEITIKNEYDESHTIRGMYVKLPIAPNGCLMGHPRFGRSILTKAELISGYVHSHMNGSSTRMGLDVCFGSGPIRSTISALNARCDPERWMLFAVQLTSFLQTESIHGGPYRRIANISKDYGAITIRNLENWPYELHNVLRSNLKIPSLRRFWRDTFKKFLSGLLDRVVEGKIIKIGFNGNSFAICDTFPRIVLNISNYFIEWVNSMDDVQLAETVARFSYAHHILERGNITSSIVRVYNSEIQQRQLDILQRELICKFKGKDIYAQIIEDDSPDTNTVTILALSLIRQIIDTLLLTLNTIYATETNPDCQICTL